MMADKAAEVEPWEESLSAFVFLRQEERIAKVLGEARERHYSLILVADEGHRLGQSLIISMDGDIMQLDRPWDWNDDIDTFRVFFQDEGGLWYGFKARKTFPHPFTISCAMPQKLAFLQRRLYPRVQVPFGTRAMLRKDGRFLSAIFVRDISPVGMLICTGSSAAGIDEASDLSDIVVSIPEHGSVAGHILPPIPKGKVVYSFFEEKNHSYCHGIAFRYDSPYVLEALGNIRPTAS